MTTWKKLFLFLFYFILLIYTLEALLFLFTTPKILTMDDLRNERIKIAKKKSIEFDMRSPRDAFLDLKKINDDLKPKFFYSPIFRFSQTFKETKKQNKIIPFRGPINSKTMSCAEEGTYNLTESDKYGFKNSNDIYKKKINTILLGDSFAEGDCQDTKNDVAGHLSKKGFHTANFGVVGTSVLVSLGIMREFGKEFRPNNFVYLYAEENDLEGLNWSKNDKHLMSYLDDDYNINYLNRYDEIKNFLKKSSIETLSVLKSKNKKNKNTKKRSEVLKENFIDIFELKQTKNIIRYKIFKKKYLEVDINLFLSVIKKMDEDAKKINSKFIFVYTPSAERYFALPEYANLKSKEQMKLKETILESVRKMNIPTIDLTIYFDKASNVEEYFSLGYIGHFNSDGYKKISEIISEKLD